jgi:hypothetical protein
LEALDVTLKSAVPQDLFIRKGPNWSVGLATTYLYLQEG